MRNKNLSDRKGQEIHFFPQMFSLEQPKERNISEAVLEARGV